MNKVIEIGNLTRDPEYSTTPNGTAVCKMSIAVNRNFTNANGEREADYFNVVAWRTLADNCARYLEKGKKIAVVGNLQTRSYDDREGVRRYVTEIMADEIEFLTPSDSGAKKPQEPSAPPKRRSIADMQLVDNDDLPF